jgi:hypothetical protein
MPDIPENWRNISDADLRSSRFSTLLDGLRESGFEGGTKLRATALARVWLRKLAHIALREVDPSSGSPPKWSDSLYPRTKPVYKDASPAKLDDSRQVFWLELNGCWTKEGYNKVEVLDSPMKTDSAIVAALSNLEAEQERCSA